MEEQSKFICHRLFYMYKRRFIYRRNSYSVPELGQVFQVEKFDHTFKRKKNRPLIFYESGKIKVRDPNDVKKSKKVSFNDKVAFSVFIAEDETPDDEHMKTYLTVSEDGHFDVVIEVGKKIPNDDNNNNNVIEDGGICNEAFDLDVDVKGTCNTAIDTPSDNASETPPRDTVCENVCETTRDPTKTCDGTVCVETREITRETICETVCESTHKTINETACNATCKATRDISCDIHCETVCEIVNEAKYEETRTTVSERVCEGTCDTSCEGHRDTVCVSNGGITFKPQTNSTELLTLSVLQPPLSPGSPVSPLYLSADDTPLLFGR